MFRKFVFYIVYFLLLVFVTLLGLEILIRMDILPNLPYYNSSGWWREEYLRGKQRYFTDTSLAKYHPFLGWDVRENIDNLQMNGYTINTNNLGFRGKRPTALEKLKAKRAIVMGDSMTFGQCVDDDQTYPAQLDRLRSDYEVLNLGVPAYGFDQQYLKLKIFGLQLHPDVVIQSFFLPDMERDATTFRDYAKPKIVRKNGIVTIINVPIKDPQHFQSFFNLRLLDYFQTIYDHFQYDAVIEEELKKTIWIMQQIIYETEQAGAKMVFVYLPNNENLLENSPTSIIFNKICADPTVLCIDPTDKLREYLSTVPHPADELKCHYSPRLQQIVAQEVSKYLP